MPSFAENEILISDMESTVRRAQWGNEEAYLAIMREVRFPRFSENLALVRSRSIVPSSLSMTQDQFNRWRFCLEQIQNISTRGSFERYKRPVFAAALGTGLLGILAWFLKKRSS